MNNLAIKEIMNRLVTIENTSRLKNGNDYEDYICSQYSFVCGMIEAIYLMGLGDEQVKKDLKALANQVFDGAMNRIKE